MSSNYPGSLDNLAGRTDASPATPNAHAQDHTDERDAINAIQAELGTDPAGASATVKARLDALDATVAGKEASGVAAALVDDLSGVTNATTARSNLGLGDAATKNVGTVAGSVAAGDDSRFTNARVPTGAAGGDLTGSYPNPTLGTGVVTSTNIADLTIVDGDISASAAIAQSKVANLTTDLAGKLSATDPSVTNARTPTAHKTTHATGGTDALTPSDIGAVPTTRTVAGKALSADVTLTASDVGAVPTTRTVAGKALSANVTLTASDVGAAATAHVHAGTDITTGTVDPARLGSGTSITTKFLRGDSTWQSVASVASDTIFDAKGDLPVGTGADTAAKLTVGSNGRVLVADSAETTGVRWGIYRTQVLQFQADDYWLMSRSMMALGYAATSTGSTASNSNNAVNYFPLSVLADITIKALALHCVTANAGANAVLRLGIYNINATTGRPGTVLLDAGTTSINAANVKELTFSNLTLKTGSYWVAVSTQGLDTAGTNPQFSGASSSGSQQGAQETAVAASNNLYPFFTSSGVTGAFADNPTVSISRATASRVFHVWGKIA